MNLRVVLYGSRIVKIHSKTSGGMVPGGWEREVGVSRAGWEDIMDLRFLETP